MRAKSICLVLTILVLAWQGSAGAEKKADGDQARLQGKWKIVEGIPSGESGLFVFEGNKFKIQKGDTENVTGTFSVDPAKKPREMNLTVTGGNIKEIDYYMGKTLLGIYEIDGDTLKWCASEPGKETRPKEFPAKAGPGPNLYLILKRDGK